MIDDMIQEIEEQYEVLYSEVLCSGVPDSLLHEFIDNPLDEGMDDI